MVGIIQATPEEKKQKNTNFKLYHQELTEKQKNEIKEAFDLFDPSGTGKIKRNHRGKRT